MRYRALAVLLLGSAMTLAAQQTTPQAPPASEAGVPTTAGDAERQTPERPGMAHPHQHGGAIGTGRSQNDGDSSMAAHIEKMRSTLEQMRANVAKVKDANVRQALQLDVDMWAHMVEHMQQMHARMQSRPGGMMGGGMAHGQGMGKGKGMGQGKGMGHGHGCCCAGMMNKSGAQEGGAAASEDMAAGMGGSGGMSCGKGGGGCCGAGDGGGCCGGHGAHQPTS